MQGRAAKAAGRTALQSALVGEPSLLKASRLPSTAPLAAANLGSAPQGTRGFAGGPNFQGFPFGAGFGSGFGGGSAPKGDSDKFYRLLGVEKSASDRELKQAYKKQAMKHHPDRGGDEATFKEISRAYEVLSKPETRQIYDTYGEQGLEGMQNQGGHGGAGVDPFDIFSQVFGFNAGGQRARGRPVTPDSIYELQTTLEEIYRGTQREILFHRDIVCGSCDGVGGHNRKTCPHCKGTGTQVTFQQAGPFYQQMQSPCPRCGAKGFTIPPGHTCKSCAGKGTRREKVSFDVDVEKGARDGSEFRFKNQADEKPGHDTGDVVIVLREKQHKVFARVRDHLVMTKRITLAEALCGFEFAITFLDGEELVIRSSSVVRPGDILTVQGKGMPRPHGQRPGDLQVILEIEFPDSVPDQGKSKILDVLGGDAISERAPGTCTAKRLSPKEVRDLKRLLSEEERRRDSSRRQSTEGDQQAQCVQQ